MTLDFIIILYKMKQSYVCVENVLIACTETTQTRTWVGVGESEEKDSRPHGEGTRYTCLEYEVEKVRFTGENKLS
ncbi:expressed protein [Echinococcus multilocularis]|uniref:Expressed protein n=1 Tax=Echinococcus multilocularis TaxID=6211 RepID=A0A068XUB6_ECHMU|nr:expressed protein [Echinococcus multilocularis]